jgi:hypothetical protein
VVLDPSISASGRAARTAALIAEVAVLTELCMSMGTRPSSNYAQRYSTEFMRDFETRFDAEHETVYKRWEQEVPAFRAWRDARRAIVGAAGRDEARLLKALCYTDDPIIVTLGPASTAHLPLVHGAQNLLVDAAMDWGASCRRSGIARNDPVKRLYGVQAPWIGGNILTTGLIAYLDKPKILRAEHGLRAALAGELTVERFRELAGLLHHVVYTMAMPNYLMYDFYHGLDGMRGPPPAPPPARRMLFLCGGPNEGIEVCSPRRRHSGGARG